jgi:hypothetical protein
MSAGEKFNAAGVNGRDCVICFRVGTLTGQRVNEATLECSGCLTRFTLSRWIPGEPDTLTRVPLPEPVRSVGLR